MFSAMKRKALLKSFISLSMVVLLITGAAFGLTMTAADPDLLITLANTDAADFSIKEILPTNQNDPRVNYNLSQSTMKIEVDGSKVYEGRPDEIPSPVTPWIRVEEGKKVVIKITVSLSLYADNRAQGVPYEYLFNFQTRSVSGSATPKIVLNNQNFHFNPNMDPGDKYEILIHVVAGGSTQPSTEPSTSPSTEPSTNPSTQPSTEPSTQSTYPYSSQPSTEPSTDETTYPTTPCTTLVVTSMAGDRSEPSTYYGDETHTRIKTGDFGGGGSGVSSALVFAGIIIIGCLAIAIVLPLVYKRRTNKRQ